jgi:predicted outer membrane lipoprotein
MGSGCNQRYRVRLQKKKVGCPLVDCHWNKLSRLFATCGALWLQHYSHVHCKNKKKARSLLCVLICNYFCYACFATCNAVWLQHYFHVHCKKQKKGGRSLLCVLICNYFCCACLQRVMLSGCNIIPMCIAKNKKRVVVCCVY